MMEATPSDSILVANDPEASSKAKQPHIPSVQASSFRKATETTKNVVTTRDNRMCWLCCIRLPSSLEVAHNINASVSLDLLEIWKGQGVLPEFFYPAHADNLILLCKNCHSAYDCNYPIWVALPQNLDLFINFENNDYAARIAAAKRGVWQSRAVLQIDRKDMLCQPYILDPSFMDQKYLDWTQFPKHFIGCPQALILKAIAGSHYPGQSVERCDSHGNVVHTGIPATVLEQVHRLVTLWNRSDPEVVTGKSGQKRQRESKDDDAKDDENDEKDNGEDPEGKDSKNFSNPDSHHSGGNSGRGRGSRATKDRPPRGAGRGSGRGSGRGAGRGAGRGSRDSTEPKNKRESELAKGLNNGRSYENLDGNEMRYGEEQFALGPDKTAADIMSMVDGWRRIQELDKAAWRARNKKVEA